MSSRSLVICDQEEGYAEALAAYLMKRKELALQVRVYHHPAQVRDSLKGHTWKKGSCDVDRYSE